MMNRREFLRVAGIAGGAAACGGLTLPGCGDDGGNDHARKGGGRCERRLTSVLDHPVSECPVDTVVVVMMENRSFDHFFGWLGDDAHYLADGRRRYGASFTIDGRVDQRFRDPLGAIVATIPVTDARGRNPYRGCGHPNPDHSWAGGRFERDHGFLALGTRNDQFAVSYFRENDLPSSCRSRSASRSSTGTSRRCWAQPCPTGNTCTQPRRRAARTAHDRSNPGCTERRRSGTVSELPTFPPPTTTATSLCCCCGATGSTHSSGPLIATSRRPLWGCFRTSSWSIPTSAVTSAPTATPTATRGWPNASCSKCSRPLPSRRSGTGECSWSCSTSGAGSSITLPRRYSATTTQARTTRTTSGRPGSECRLCWRRHTPGAVLSTIACTTTRRSCGSSNGDSSVRLRRVPARARPLGR